jgi:class 3 adenylate cyclase/pimeloyl-ACP methyl ester carboxylesterase
MGASLMEPRIQYAHTADGVSIAFWTLGEGMPLVHLAPLPLSHVQSEWEISEFRRWFERLAQNKKLVRYDARGCGLSDRDISDLSLDAYVRDLETVVDRLGAERFALLAVYNSGPLGIAYAARHPERVSHLILWCARANFTGPSARPSQQDQWERLFVETTWDLYTETMVHQSVGWSEGEAAHRMAELMRNSVTPEHMQAFMDAYPNLDVAALLPEVRSPTLVLQRRQVDFPGMDVARGLASRIPDARLVVVEGESMAPFAGDMEGVLATIDEFLGLETTVEPEPAPATWRGGLVTLLFTDVEGSTSLTQRLGDTRAREVLRTHERIVRDALRAHGGSEVKTMGDGFMASFSSATRALECAIAMQRAFAEHNETAEEPIRVRIGLNAGEPIAEEADLFGTAVIVAARIAARAEGGEILAANVVRELAAGKGFLFADRGDVVLRGFEDPVRLYEVRWREDG